MLNQSTVQSDLTMWTTTESHGDTTRHDGVFQRRIYWDLNKAIVLMVTLVTLVMGVAGNVLVILTVFIRRLLHNPMSCYLANLAVVHTLLSLVVCPFLTFHVLRDAHYRREVCAAFYILLYSLALLVALGVLTIGVDRVWKERWSWHYLSHHSGRLALAVVAGCWAAALALVVALELTGSTQHPLRSHLCPDDRETWPRTTAAPGDIAMEVIFYTSYGTAFVCLVVVQVMYGRKARKTGHLPGTLTGDALVKVPEREAAAVREAGGKLSPQLGKRLYEDGDQETRSVRTLLLLVLLHTVCWAPFYVVYSLNAHVSARIVPYNIVEIVHYLAMLSSPLNPLLYYFSSVEFNRTMRQLISTMCCRPASLASGSTVTLEWEPLHTISDDQLQAFNAEAERLSIAVSVTPVPSVGLPCLKSDIGISVGSSKIDLGSPRRELQEVTESAGPSTQLYGRNNLPPLSPRRSQLRPSDTSLLHVWESRSFGAPSPARVIEVPSNPSPAPAPPMTPAGDAVTPGASPDAGSRAGGRRGDSSAGDSDAGVSQHSSRSHRVIASFKNLFHRGRAGRSDSASSGTDSASGTPEPAAKPGFAARVAALWQRRRRTAPGNRSGSEQSLVRRLVLAGLPSGVQAAGGRRRRLSGVWRSPGGTLHRLDPDSDQYHDLLERIAATDSGYRSPAGQRIHHVCERHHVHARCHHHDVAREVAPPPGPARQQASRGNWTTEQLEEVRRPAGPLVSPARPHGSGSSSGSEDADTVQRVSNPRKL